MGLVIGLVVVLINQAVQAVGVEPCAGIVHNDVGVALGRFAASWQMVHDCFGLVVEHVQWRLVDVLFG